MWIIPKDDTSPARLLRLVEEKMKLSRFHARLEVGTHGKSPGLKLTVIRLKRKKSYCGAHPGPCPNDGNRRHTNSTFLEGQDWIGFNAMLNDVLDKNGVDCTVFSYNREKMGGGKYYVRRGKLRRVNYPYKWATFWGRTFAHWIEGKVYECFADYCGKEPPPVEELDDGTPGYPCYTLEEEDRYRAEEAA